MTLLGLITELLVERDDSLGNGLTDSLHLRAGATTADADTDAQVLESVSTKQQDWLVNFQSQGCWFKDFDGSSIYSDVSVAFCNVCDSSGVLLSSESLYLFSLTHLSFLRYGVLNVGETRNNN